MSQKEVEELKTIQSIVDEILAGIEPMRVKPDSSTIKQYCEMVGDNNPVYFDDDSARREGYPGAIVPQSYLMTLFVPIVNEVFIKGAEKLFTGLIRGVIHSGSEVVYDKPLMVGETYVMHLESVSLNKKSGDTGDYYVWTFRAVVSSEDGEEQAYDKHTFFLKI
ncbi:MAG: MaoC family dehydratase N-terminal domain-containing protein [Candidatus Freyarchaeum deiterrae]